MLDDIFHSDTGADGGQSEAFFELGTNRLARDMFLLTAVCALFLLMFVSSPLWIAAERSWSREARVLERESAGQGMVLSLHLRRDGRIQVGKSLVASPAEAGTVVRQLLETTPALRQAKVVMSTYHLTPSVVTSDVVRALSDAGLEPGRFYLRFTEE